MWGKSKDKINTTDAIKSEGQELPIKDTKSGSDNFDNIEINVPTGAGHNVLPSTRT